MPRTGGEKSRLKILHAAEYLFSEYGFDATSVDKIAEKANVNKAMIYYHFKNKDDLIAALFTSVIEQITAASSSALVASRTTGEASIAKKVESELIQMTRWKKILSVLLMEALKGKKSSTALFRCADLALANERETQQSDDHTSSPIAPSVRNHTFEFFSGFIPMMTFIVMQDAWCKYYHFEKSKATEAFIDVFIETHLRAHRQFDTTTNI